jgi:hypothetical protein
VNVPLRILLTATLVLGLAAGCSDSGDDDAKETTTTAAADPAAAPTETTTAGGTDTTAVPPPTIADDAAPTAATVSAGLQSGLGLPLETSDCIAAQLVEVLSEDALRALANRDQAAMPAEERQEVEDEAAKAAANC